MKDDAKLRAKKGETMMQQLRREREEREESERVRAAVLMRQKW